MKTEVSPSIELLVVVLILGILMAIAIPTFLSLTGGAKTNAAEADLTTAAQDEATYLTTNGSFDTASATATTATTDNVTAMTAADPGINWVVNTPGAAGTKSVAVTVTYNTSTSHIAYLETAASNGTWYWIEDNQGALTYAQTSAVLTGATVPIGVDFGTHGKRCPLPHLRAADHTVGAEVRRPALFHPPIRVEDQILSLAASHPDLLTGYNPLAGKAKPCGSAGVDSNCAVIGFTSDVPRMALTKSIPNSQCPPL